MRLVVEPKRCPRTRTKVGFSTAFVSVMTPRRLVKQTSKIAFVEEGVFEVELGLSQVKLIDFISPLKALWVNFRFNQVRGENVLKSVQKKQKLHEQND